MNEALIEDWKDTIGLTVDRVEEYENDNFDDPVEYRWIFFTNGQYVIQRDQSYHTTTCGLVGLNDFKKILIEISESKRIK
jgi:hypothetical protein